MNDRAAYANADARLLPLPDKSVHMIATSPPYWGLRSYDTGDNKPAELGAEKVHDCLAWARGEEPCGACYVCHLREWAAEMWRVLRDDGCMFLNLGDSYASSGKAGPISDKSTWHGGGAYSVISLGRAPAAPGLKPKDLVGIPWRVALALQADGWYLRSDIIWAKPNSMPESVTDRPTKAHEYIFLLTKSARYYWDGEAVKEKSQSDDRARTYAGQKKALIVQGNNHGPNSMHRPENALTYVTANRNLRTVWNIATQPYSGAHYATWPPALVERMVKAGTSERGVCPECGKPWERVVERVGGLWEQRKANGEPMRMGLDGHGAIAGITPRVGSSQVTTTGWRPGCTCNIDGIDLRPDDLDVITTPIGERVAEDPSRITGRAGYNRPRGDNEGQRPITRYEQRRYADQLRQSAARALMASETGSAFDHYARTDSSGARPIPQDLLDKWIDAGWLERVTVPEFRPYAPVPAVVLDPFAGSGTTLLVARQLGRIGLGFDLSETYLRDNAAVRLGHDKLAAWGRGIVDTGDYTDLFCAHANEHDPPHG